MSDITHVQLVMFSLAGERYALPIGHVQEIIRYVKPRPVDAGSAVCGVISLRGQVIPVIDLAEHLSLGVRSAAASAILIVQTTEHTLGVIVDEVDEVHAIPADDIEEMPLAGNSALDGIAKVGEHLVALVDAVAIAEGLGWRAQVEPPAPSGDEPAELVAAA